MEEALKNLLENYLRSGNLYLIRFIDLLFYFTITPLSPALLGLNYQPLSYR